MRKKAVIVVGSHFSGKSLTVNKHLKPLLQINPQAHIFDLNGQKGFVLSQSSEESGQNVEKLIEKYSHFDLFVLASRPETDERSNFKATRAALERASFEVNVVVVHSREETPDKARAIFKLLSQDR
jgi:hypothetical protein